MPEDTGNVAVVKPHTQGRSDPVWQQPSSSASGLSNEEAARRLETHGANDPTRGKKGGQLIELWQLCTNPLVIILVIAAVISGALGETTNALIILTMVVISLAINLFQTYRSQESIKKLRAQVAATATVMRDGNWTKIARSELVVGDVIRLSGGDLVPADARLIASRDLHVQEAALTGESLPVEKDIASSDAVETDRQKVFLGTSVISGTATAVITATGPGTAFGQIADRLARRAPQTEFERGLHAFGALIMKTVVFLVLFVFLVTAALRHDPWQSLLFAVALAVGLTPEFLPMITTVTLGRGAVRMARKKVIVKHLSAIQNFGSIDTLCSDKTGTLTSGQMKVDQCIDTFGKPDEFTFKLAYINSFNETGIPHPFDDAILRKGGTNPLDIAILSCDHVSTQEYQKLDEIPFDFERRRLSIVVKESDARALLITKGSPEGILPCCSTISITGMEQPLDAASHNRAEETYKLMSSRGLRVLAVAYKYLPLASSFSKEDETALTLAGFVTFEDPPLKGVSEILRMLSKDGVDVKILTGDNELVAKYVCERVGLEASEIVLGSEIQSMTDSALAYVAEHSRVFARVSPGQKTRIILALKSRSHVVGFLGDGINDAPSLHTADVGISVSNAVDVAREAADIILLEPGLRILHTGIFEGRRAFGNVMKYLLMGTSSNFGNMFSMAVAAVFLPFLPMLPTQILLNNFLYDLAQVTIPTDNVDSSYIRNPRRWDVALIRRFMIYIGPISSIYDFLTFFALLRVFHASEALFHTGWFVESLATQTLVLFVIRTAGNPLRSRPSRPLTVTTICIVLIGTALPYLPVAREFGFVPLPVTFLLFVAVATATYLLLVEIAKRKLMGQSQSTLGMGTRLVSASAR